MRTIHQLIAFCILQTAALTAPAQDNTRLDLRAEELVRVLSSVTPPPQPGEVSQDVYRLSLNDAS